MNFQLEFQTDSWSLRESQTRNQKKFGEISKQVIEEEAKDNIPIKKARKRSKWISNEAIKIAEKRRMAKARGNRSDMAKWNAILQKQIRKDKEKIPE